jgi:hypothetical protein
MVYSSDKCGASVVGIPPDLVMKDASDVRPNTSLKSKRKMALLAAFGVVALVAGVSTAVNVGPATSTQDTNAATTMSVKTCQDGLDVYLQYLAQRGEASMLNCSGVDTGTSIPSSIGDYTHLTAIQ